MYIKQITLASEHEIDIVRTDHGATVLRDGAPFLKIDRFESRDERFAKASRIYRRWAARRRRASSSRPRPVLR